MFRTKMKLAALAALMILGSAAAQAEDKAKVGEKVTVGGRDFKVDTSPRGEVTVRGTDRTSPSVTVGGEGRTRENPKGEVKATVGVTKEF
jgi:hypothetical protein